jgi:GNAT superfamily N-acetyltransferase
MYKYFLYGLRVEAIEAETLVVVGSMFITEEHVIQSIYVNPPHRRKGVATAMYRFALLKGFILQHSQSVSEEGRQWIESL